MPAFRVTWKIENFSRCGHQVGERLLSPDFSLPQLKNVTWKVWIYPRGSKNECANNVSVFIQRYDKDANAKTGKFRASFKILHSDHDESREVNSTFEIKANGGWGYRKFISRGELNQNYGFLPQDILTVQIDITPLFHDEKLSTKLPGIEKLSLLIQNKNFNAEEWYFKENETSNMTMTQCSFLTRIPVERRILKWDIHELNAKRKSREKMSLLLKPDLYDGVTLLLVCYFADSSSEDEESLKIKITRKGVDDDKVYIQYEVTCIDSSETERNLQKSDHVFNETYNPLSFTLIDKLNASKDLIKNDSLKMKFCISISYEPYNVKHFQKSYSSTTSDLQNEIQKMLEHEETVNCCFECEKGSQFQVHQFLMCAKSPVFRAMFSSDTLEKQTGVIPMKDIDTSTVRLLRDYLYSDKIPDLELEGILKLYLAADKYQIRKLKHMCSVLLKNSISVDNVCDVIILADMHQDNGLKKYLMDFLIAEMDFNSDTWENFTAENMKLAAETMKICLVKVKQVYKIGK